MRHEHCGKLTHLLLLPSCHGLCILPGAAAANMHDGCSILKDPQSTGGMCCCSGFMLSLVLTLQVVRELKRTIYKPKMAVLVSI